MPTYALSNVYVLRYLSHKPVGEPEEIGSVSLDTSTLPPGQPWVLADSNAGAARKIAGNTDLISDVNQLLNDYRADFSIDYDFGGPADAYVFVGLIDAEASSPPEIGRFMGDGYMSLEWMYEQDVAGSAQVFMSYGSYVPEGGGGGGDPPDPFWTNFIGSHETI